MPVNTVKLGTPTTCFPKADSGPPRKKQKFLDIEGERKESSDPDPLILPSELKSVLALSTEDKAFVQSTRREIANIICGRDDRLLCVVGPCSIHDEGVAVEYGRQLKQMADEFQGELLVIMRVYFEKPRTTIGWKGLINDPDLNGTFNINKGIALARSIVLQLIKQRVGTGCEWLDMITPEYLSDVYCWGAIGARTTESQPHRQMVSAMSMPVGFKNSTTGKVDVAANACISAAGVHCFMGTVNGRIAIIRSTGNKDCHIIHRGGSNGPNYDAASIMESSNYLRQKKLNPAIVIDCSHGNSKKDYRNQPIVAASIADQVSSGSKDIAGVMIESNINEGKQKLDMNNVQSLEYGKSITDSCVDIKTTYEMLKILAAAVHKRRNLEKMVDAAGIDTFNQA